jgi:polyhydroxyalkanoate synthesis repressor PhaR
MPPKFTLIRKYENRRLYDVTNSRYVNLEEVAQFIRSGHEVRVVDAASDKDITRLILTQIITEDAKSRDSSFPLDLLRQMIITSGRASQETALGYMKAMVDLYQDTYRAMSPAVNPFGMFAPGLAGSGVPGKDQPGPATSPSEEHDRKAPPETEHVDELKQRVADLERLVSSLNAQKPGQRKTRHTKPAVERTKAPRKRKSGRGAAR